MMVKGMRFFLAFTTKRFPPSTLAPTPEVRIMNGTNTLFICSKICKWWTLQQPLGVWCWVNEVYWARAFARTILIMIVWYSDVANGVGCGLLSIRPFFVRKPLFCKLCHFTMDSTTKRQTSSSIPWSFWFVARWTSPRNKNKTLRSGRDQAQK